MNRFRVFACSMIGNIGNRVRLKEDNSVEEMCREGKQPQLCSLNLLYSCAVPSQMNGH